ncbi:NADH-ubiquinone oxidoreductase-F iron-sulfur binding region domain-containing protein [Altericroceibacterium xinjiangense]|uniref:NADH-ubiquinone oxidoreductase-F iron-sulfur binding region domain-containing protein n=1 Tax=Altericroceibacterium xinjiangense TaxID=762261 RepID=UPI000F7F5618|nr:NADH-ubiquinone oxidoreductase-F iron-sulfur binding region domain-containing protein [Altericroceibacterium xinjiangense]
MTQTIVRISDDALARAVGADALAAAFEKQGCDVQRTSSWGMHWLEPLVEIDGKGFGPATLADVDAILSGTSDRAIGAIEDHPFIARQQRLTFARAGKTRPLSLEDYEGTGGWSGLKRARQIGSDAIIEEVTRSGLRGRGGAGFPAGIKWRTVANAVGDRKYIVCNADEGDSGTFADRMMMEGDPYALIEGMAIAGEAVGALKGFVYIRSEYPDAIRKMERAAQLCAHIIAPFEVEIRVGAGAYVCGEETSLLNSLEGVRGEVRAKPPLPAIRGLFGRPTVVNNVLTLSAVPHILGEGGANDYEALGMGRSKGTMPIQLAGNIKHGGLYEAAFGVTLGELVNDIGGGTHSGRPVKAVQVGGPLGAYLPPEQFDIVFDYEAYTAADALIGHGGITVFDDTADMGSMARFAMEFCAAESCGKCTPCRIGSVRGIELIDRILAGKETGGGRQPDRIELSPVMQNAPKRGRTAEEEIELLTDLCETMKFGSLCALGGFTPYPVLSALKHWPQDFTGEAVAERELGTVPGGKGA